MSESCPHCSTIPGSRPQMSVTETQRLVDRFFGTSAGLPKVPLLGDWVRVGVVPIAGTDGLAVAWQHPSGAQLLSAVEIASDPDGGFPEWHVSVSFRGGMAPAAVMGMVRRDFLMADAWEDNHGEGVVRHLWLAVNPSNRRDQCHCVNEVAPTVDGERVWRP